MLYHQNVNVLISTITTHQIIQPSYNPIKSNQIQSPMKYLKIVKPLAYLFVLSVAMFQLVEHNNVIFVSIFVVSLSGFVTSCITLALDNHDSKHNNQQ